MDSSENQYVGVKESTSKFYIETTWNKFNSYRQSEQFSDVKLILPNGSIFNVHSIVMMCGSEYFRAALEFDEERRRKSLPSNSKKEKDIVTLSSLYLESDLNNAINELDADDNFDSQKTRTITLDRDVSKDEFEKILKFIYTGKILITTDCVSSLHDNAIFFNLLHLKDLLTGFMLKTLDLLTALKYWRQSEFNPTLESNCLEFIGRNCELFLKTYLEDLTLIEMNELTRCEKLDCSEEVLFSYVLKWLNNNWIEREPHLTKLFNNIRFISVPYESVFELFFVKLEKFRNSKENSAAILYDHIEKNKSNDIENIKNISSTPRIGFREKQLFITTTLQIRALDESAFAINHVHGMGARCTEFGRNYLLMSGGNPIIDGETEITANCSYYCPILNQIKSFPAMNLKRSYHGVTTLNSTIYACGGIESLKSMEVFDLKTCIWIQGPNMNRGRTEFGITSNSDCLYIIGGENSEIGSIERFDPRENKWCEIFDLPKEYSNQSTNSIMIDDCKIISFTNKTLYTFDVRSNQILKDETLQYPVVADGYKTSICQLNSEIYYIVYYPPNYSASISKFCPKDNKFYKDFMSVPFGGAILEIGNVVSLYK